MKKFISMIIGVMTAAFVWAPLASAHVSVTPDEAAPAERVTFSVSVPNEKEIPVTELRLDIPAGLASVTPTVHPGWTIETAQDGETVRSITWKGGEIPAGQRDDFTFRAQTPEKAGELQWKAYQTYADGTTVAWDQKPAAEDHGSESETSGPYSVTTIEEPAAEPVAEKSGYADQLALGLSLVALLLGVLALLQVRKKA